MPSGSILWEIFSTNLCVLTILLQEVSLRTIKVPLSSLVAQMVKCLPVMWETQVQSLGPEDPLEKEMAIHSSTLAWKIPWMEEHGRLHSMGSQRVRHDWETELNGSYVMLWGSLNPASPFWTQESEVGFPALWVLPLPWRCLECVLLWKCFSEWSSE